MNAKSNRPNLGRLRPAPAVLLVAALVLAAGCFTATGQRPDYAPAELLALADQACQRRDPAAARMLLERLVDDHAGSPQADRAGRLLSQPTPCPDTPADAAP